MVRVLASLMLVLTLPACAITPPTSVFANLTATDAPSTQQQQTAKRAASPMPVAQKSSDDDGESESTGGIGSSIGNIWDSVKSGLGVENEPQKAMVPANAPITMLDANAALSLVNSYRTQKGLKPLKINPKLNEAARAHSEDLAKSDRISHFGSDGSDHWQRITRAGYPARLTAENVATGQTSINEVFRGWQKSRDHNTNLLLADAEEMGIAMVYKPDTQFKTFWTLVLGSKD